MPDALRHRWPLLLALALVVALVATVLTVRGDEEGPDGDGVGDPMAEGTGPDQDGEESEPLRMLLRQGTASTTTVQQVAVVEGEALPQDRLQAILDRLEPFAEDPGDREAFNRPAETLPPPVAGQTVAATFPPAATPPTDAAPEAPAGPLQVVRVQPEGEVDIAPSLSITFDQPMVPLATLEQLDAADVTVTMTPEVDGRWRWIGTRTLRFEATPTRPDLAQPGADPDAQPDLGGPPVDRLPMATDFSVTVPAGTTSATGGTLADAVTFSFTTPAPVVQAVVPQGDSLPLTPVFVIVFDQVVDPQAVVDHVDLDADGTRAVRLATSAEVEADDTARTVASQALEGRWVALRPVDPLPADTPLTLTVQEGTPSAEGPRTTPADQVFTARTFPPLTITRAGCGHGQVCRPGQPLVIELSNPLDLAAFDPAEVTVEPDLPGLSVTARDFQVVVTGSTVADTTYRITLPAGLADARGQTLGTEQSREVAVAEPLPSLRRSDTDMVTVDPLAEQPSLSLVSAGHEELRVTALDVDPEYWSSYITTDRYSDELEPPDLPVLLERTVQTGAADGTTVETIVDLSEVFAEGHGQALVYVEPVRTFPRNSEEYWNNLPLLIWVQATTVGIDAIADGQQLVVWTTDLRDGTPIAGAEVANGGATATTDADGLATFPLDGTGDPAITATVGEQTALLGSGWRERWQAQPRTDITRWYVLDDRGLYRPGEAVRLKGWVRRLQLSGGADLALFDAGTTVDYQVFDGQYTEVATGQAQLNALGGFDLAVDLPEGANLGQGIVAFQLSGATGVQDAYFEHPLRIEEFRRPEFEVITRPDSPVPHVITEPVTVAAEASYFAGGGLPNAPVTWTVTQRDTTYAPPGWEGFAFGKVVPFWFGGGGIAGGYGGFGGGGIAYEEGFGGGSAGGYGGDICCFPGGEETVERFAGVTDASGRHLLEIAFEGDAPDQPIQVSANAAVENVNRQAFASTTDLLVHAGKRYLGLRTDRAFVRQGDPIRVDAVLTDIDGAAVPGQTVTVVAERLVEEVVDGQVTEVAVDPVTCDIASAADPQGCELPTTAGGRHRISGTVTDADGGTNRTEVTVWVSGAEAVPTRRVKQDQLTLIPAVQDHVVGDTAEILVPAPFAAGTGLVTISRNGITESRIMPFTDGSVIVEVPLTEAMVPGITVQVDLVGTAPRVLDDGSPATDLPARPAFATGVIDIAVPPTSRTLVVEATPRDAVALPGASTAIDVAVTDAGGNPVEGADVALVAVDEAVLSLIGYDPADPVETFHAAMQTWLDSEYLRRTILLSRSDVVTGGVEGTDTAAATSLESADATEEAMTEGEAATDDSAGGGEAAAPPLPAASPAAALTNGRQSAGQDGTPIQVRTDFDALAVWAPSVVTGSDGRASVDVELPDSLTRYRIIAVAASGADRFGKGEANLTARLPLQVRPSAPRFANFGDTFELPVVVQNQTEDDLTADVVLETANLIITGQTTAPPSDAPPSGASPSEVSQAGVTITVPAGDRVEVRFPVAAEDAGTARFRVTAVTSGDGSGEGSGGVDAADSATMSLPVYTPTTSESFATYGVIDAGALAQPLLTPEGVVPQFGGLEVTTSSTALQALTDAVLYLSEYPYDSTDAFASRIIAISALRDVLAAFEAEQLPPAAEIEQTVASDIAGLVGLQNDDGGWSVWQRNRPTEPYHTVQATHALIAARDAGYDVPAGTIDRALERLRTIEATIDPQWSETARQTIRAYALHVRDLAGDRDPARAAEVYAALQAAAASRDPDAGTDAPDDTVPPPDVPEPSADGLPLDAIAWLWPVLDDEGLRSQIELTFANQVTETPSAATFTTGYGEDAYLVLGSDRRTDGIILNAYLAQQPGSDLVPKIVNGLIANQKQGRWDNVQENAFILLALKRYFDTFEAATPDFVARVWLGDLYAAEHAYQGRTTDSTLTVVPTAELLSRDDATLVLSKEGEGRLYYRLGLRTAPDDLQLEPRDEGFVVQRRYEAVGDPADVTLAEDGTWRIRAGAEVRVRLTMVADSRRVNMALVDPLPAGLEIVNPALAASPALPPEPEVPSDLATPDPFATYSPAVGASGFDPSFGGEFGGGFGRFGGGWYPTWFDHQNLRDDRAEAFSGFLPAGTYSWDYIARATTPGTFVVPPATAEEIYTPEVFGRTATDTVVITG